jgi:hypothetical protein
MSEKMIFNSTEEVQQSLNSGDKEKELSVANAILAGNIEIKQSEIPKEETDVQLPQNQQTKEEKTEENEEVKVEPIVNDSLDEVERQRRYSEFLEKKAQEDNDRYLIELKNREELIKKEKAEREELEKKLRQLEEIKKEQPSTAMSNQDEIDEEDEFATEYSKKTRKMVEELKSQVGDSPVVKELVEKIRKIESEYETQKNENLKNRQEKERKEQEEKVFDSIRQFQIKYPELQTKQDIQKLDEEYLNFRKNIAYITKAKNSKDLEEAIENYYNDGDIKKLADQHGIKPMEDYNKYITIANLMDIKSGIQRNPKTGEEKPILDENGEQVRYRSIEEVYRLSNYHNDLTKARQNTMKEVSKKLEEIQSAPVTLSPDSTGTFTTGYTQEQIREILSWDPKVWVNDPEKKRIVEEVYLKQGLPPPRYRGRR